MLVINGNSFDIYLSVFDLYRPLPPNGTPIFQDALVNPDQGMPAAPFAKDSDGNYSIRWIATPRTGGAPTVNDILYDSGSEDNITVTIAANLAPDLLKLREEVAKLVTGARDDPKIKQQLRDDPAAIVKERFPAIGQNLTPAQTSMFAEMVLAGTAETDKAVASANGAVEDKGGFLCPACRSGIYLALVAGGVGAVILAGATGGAAVGAEVAAAAGIIATASAGALTAAQATALVWGIISGAAGKSLNDVFNEISNAACVQMGC